MKNKIILFIVCLAASLMTACADPTPTNAVRISALGTASTLAGAEIFPLLQSGFNRQATIAQIATYSTAQMLGLNNTWTAQQNFNGGITIGGSTPTLLNGFANHSQQVIIYGNVGSSELDFGLYYAPIPSLSFTNSLVATAGNMMFQTFTGGPCSVTASAFNGSGSGLTGIPVSALSASGTPNSSTYYRGDGTWSTPSGGGGGSGAPLNGTNTWTGTNIFSLSVTSPSFIDGTGTLPAANNIPSLSGNNSYSGLALFNGGLNANAAHPSVFFGDGAANSEMTVIVAAGGPELDFGDTSIAKYTNSIISSAGAFTFQNWFTGAKLQLNAGVGSFTGAVTASSFNGSGSNLTSIPIINQNLTGLWTNVVWLYTNTTTITYGTNGGTLTVFLGTNFGTFGGGSSGPVLKYFYAGAGGGGNVTLTAGPTEFAIGGLGLHGASGVGGRLPLNQPVTFTNMQLVIDSSPQLTNGQQVFIYALTNGNRDASWTWNFAGYNANPFFTNTIGGATYNYVPTGPNPTLSFVISNMTTVNNCQFTMTLPYY